MADKYSLQLGKVFDGDVLFEFFGSGQARLRGGLFDGCANNNNNDDNNNSNNNNNDLNSKQNTLALDTDECKFVFTSIHHLQSISRNKKQGYSAVYITECVVVRVDAGFETNNSFGIDRYFGL